MLYNRFDLEVQQGTTWQLQVNVQDANTNPINLYSYSAVLTIGQSWANVTTIIDTLSTGNGEIMIANAGSYIFTWPAYRTANVFVDTSQGTVGNPPKTTYVYDVNITSNTGVVTKIMFGNMNVYAGVSNP